jgi:type II secretory ATPase GspE/PulE/Tfp pilus assembly ATPase PilB-like protein
MAGSSEPHRIQGLSSSSTGRIPLPPPASSPSSERLVNEMILKGFRLGASDLHLEPNPDHLLVRARIDGVLQVIEKVPQDQMKQVISRLKIMAQVESADSRTPTDGRFNFARFEPTAKELDVRASFMPTFFGEKAVLRLVDHSRLKLSMEELGFTADSARLYTMVVGKPSGIVLHVGPQGSGKTTTAYGAIKNFPRPQASLVTVEEMIEYVLPGITQVQLNPELGFDYRSALQGVLRQDPDVILVGEIKDTDTARIAIEAAMSGRLVITTLHASSMPGAVARLVELGFSRPQVAHSIAGVLSQRLVRRLCLDCRERIVPSTLIRSALVLPTTAQSVFKAKACRRCGKGFKGRVALYEVVNFSDRMREAVASGAGNQQLDAISIAEGTVPLLRDAVEKVLRGDTSVEEVLRALCGVSVEDVGAITEPGEMVNFLKTVRDQFLPSASVQVSPALPAIPPRAPSSHAIPLPAPRSTSSMPRTTQPYPSGSFPAAMLDEPRPPSGRHPVPEGMYSGASNPPPTNQGLTPGGRDMRTTSGDDFVRTLMSSLPPEIAAQLARAAQQASQSQPQALPRPATQPLSPELMRQLQELQKRLRSPDQPG